MTTISPSLLKTFFTFCGLLISDLPEVQAKSVPTVIKRNQAGVARQVGDDETLLRSQNESYISQNRRGESG
jgi:hypothetical protein